MIRPANLRSILEEIRLENGGLLRPCDMVASAKPKSSPLHDMFEWDNSAAAEQWRLQQARQIINVVVTVDPNISGNKKLRAFVSISRDRNETGGGYRSMVEVISDAEMRKELLKEAMQSLSHWEQKYQDLAELKPIMAAARHVRSRQKTRKPMAKNRKVGSPRVKACAGD